MKEDNLGLEVHLHNRTIERKMGICQVKVSSPRSHPSLSMRCIFVSTILIFLSVFSPQVKASPGQPQPQPSLEDSMQNPIAVAQGDNAALTCVVRGLGESVLIWKKWESGKLGPKILTAGEKILTSDDRMKIIHDDGGDVWVLAIRETRANDSGVYICEINTKPVLRSFHNLTVISLEVSPPHHNNESYYSFPSGDDLPFQEFSESYKGQGSIANHNYTSCCLAQNVSKSCLGFCTLQSILDGSTGEPSQCENDFPRIVKCMADGRDHVPCCVLEGVPDICQDLCRGEYTIVTDNVKTHFSCPTFIERTLACISDGVEILPSEPLNLEAIAISQSSINVSWSPPSKNADTVTEYIVNITTLRGYDVPYNVGSGGYGIESGGSSSSIAGSSSPNISTSTSTSTSISINHRGSSGIDISSEEKVEPKMRQIKVHDATSVVINQLEPFTMYEISVTTFNIHGRSLPSTKLRTLTLAPGIIRPNSTASPTLPDIKTCCIQNGVNSESCVSKLCDPTKTTSLEIPDLMICAPWTPQVFKCLADGIDHSPCCRQRGISDLCSDLCSGNVTKVDYHYFKCLRYMPEYTNCLMDGYGVLPSAPRQVRVSNINAEYVIVHWGAPARMNDSVTGYNIHYRPVGTYENLYSFKKNVHPPYILEDLYANADYEVYIEALNEYGVSEPSQRVVFRTSSKAEENAEIEEALDLYNETACCVSAGLSPTCLPLCSYDASMSDIRSLAFACASEFHTILRCAAGGRDHSSCCTKRGVTESCLDVCRAVVPDSLKSMAENCLPFIGNIIQCFDEGTELIPSPVEEFHAFLITDSSVGLAWDSPTGYNITQYQVFYETKGVADKPKVVKSVNVTDTYVEIQGLDKGSIYKFYAVAENEHGSSVPSSIVEITVNSEDYDGSKISGIVSAPHGLVVAGHGATWVQIVWQPPAIAHPSDRITYKIYHRGVKDGGNEVNESSVNSISLENLKPNSQYIVYVTASTAKGESSPSETLIAWTDPAHSPFVEPPRIQPLNLLVEGRSMTIVCVALGDPTPTISLYINGKLIKQQKNRHLTQVIDNITRDMDIVSCYADNGYGTPMQAARKINVSHVPSISGSELIYGRVGTSASIECTVVSYPEPKVAFWKKTGQLQKLPIVDGGNYRISQLDDGLYPFLDEPHKVKYTMKIVNFTDEFEGNYSCHADNAIGEKEKVFTVKKIDLQDASINITECCVREKVSTGCMDLCSVFTEVESILEKPQCLSDYNKLIKCSADGRDHRACCANAEVPRRCLDLCRGDPVSHNADLCILQYSPKIFNCFKDHRDKLPSPPQNVRVEILTDTEARISWDIPAINPHTATVYRVFWRQVGQKMSERQDTQTTTLKLSNLKPGAQYETVIKAGNSRGTSILTEPLSFTLDNNFISSASTAEASNVGLGFGIAVLVCLALGGVVVAAWYLRNRQFGLKPPGAIAFENPSYIRETNPDVHMNGDGPSLNGSVPSVSNGLTGNGWHTESLHPRSETEVAPTLYEELRLGSEGAGFRRLK